MATVGRRGYKFIATVEAQERFRGEQAGSPANVASADVVPPSPIAKTRVLLGDWVLRVAGLALAAAVILAIWAWAGGRLPESLHRRPPGAGGEGISSAAAVRPRRSFAVLALKNHSGKPDEAWLSTALSEMLATELAAGEQMRAVPGEKVTQAKIDLGLADADGYSPETLARIRSNLGSDVVVLGSYTALGQKSNGSIRVDLRLQEAATGETIAEVATTGNETELFDLVSRAGVQLRRKLGVEPVSTDQAAVVRASAPLNSEAARLYAEGLAKLRVFDALAARDLLPWRTLLWLRPGRLWATMERPKRNPHWPLSFRETSPVKTACRLRANTGKRKSSGTRQLTSIRVCSPSSLTAWTMD